MSVLQSACVCIVQNSMPRGACGFYLYSAELQQQSYQCFITKQWPMTLYKQVLGDAGEEKIPFIRKRLLAGSGTQQHHTVAGDP